MLHIIHFLLHVSVVCIPPHIHAPEHFIPAEAWYTGAPDTWLTDLVAFSCSSAGCVWPRFEHLWFAWRKDVKETLGSCSCCKHVFVHIFPFGNLHGTIPSNMSTNENRHLPRTILGSFRLFLGCRCHVCLQWQKKGGHQSAAGLV